MLEPTDDPFTKLLEAPPFFDSWYTWIAIALVAVLAGFRTYLRGPQYFSKISLDGKVALVTGGNRGIGFHTAKELANRGAKVYIACRDSELGRAAEARIRSLTGSPDVHFLPLALGSLEEVRKFCGNFKKKEEKLDILYCNAGVMICPNSKTVDGFEYHFGVNYIAHYLLVNELLPLVRAATPSRIVIITSAAYALGVIHYEDINQEKADYGNGAECFSQSKLALMLMMNKLSRNLEGSGVTVNACHPGVVKTDIHRYMPIRTSSFLNVSTYPVCWYMMKSSSDGAQTPIFLCIDDTVKTASGKYYVDMQEKSLGLAGNEAEADKLWQLTEGLIEAADRKRQADQSASENKHVDQSGEREESADQPSVKKEFADQSGNSKDISSEDKKSK